MQSSNSKFSKNRCKYLINHLYTCISDLFCLFLHENKMNQICLN
nr:MAG TPA: hypothetical protein [Crassvirales sp.]